VKRRLAIINNHELMQTLEYFMLSIPPVSVLIELLDVFFSQFSLLFPLMEKRSRHYGK
jgi:hypothetical protein